MSLKISRKEQILIPAFSVLFAILLFEAVAALMLPKPPVVTEEHRFWQTDPEIGWVHQPSVRGYFENRILGFNNEIQLDEHGMRVNGNQLTAPVKKTVMIFGDSVTAGFEVKTSETFSSILERELSTKDFAVRVVNAGVRGYGTDQVYRAMKRFVSIYKPDLVLYEYTWNDLYDNLAVKNRYRQYSKFAYVLDDQGLLLAVNDPVVQFGKGNFEYAYFDGGLKINKGSFQTGGLFSWLHENSKIYSSVEDLYFRYVVHPPSIQGYEAIDEKYTRRLFKAIVRKMATDIPNLAITAFTGDSAGLRVKNEYAIEAAREAGVDFIDLRPSFPASSVSVIYPEDGHWNATGHRDAANGLKTYLQKKLELYKPAIAQ